MVQLQPPAPADAPAPDTLVDQGASRRFFLAGTGAMALAATAGATTAWNVAGRQGPDAAEVLSTDLEAGTVIAYIRPGETEITVISGEREVVVDDPALARAITRMAGTR